MSLIIDSRKSIIMNKKGGIFAVAARAKKRIQEIGADKVINSTLGTGLDEKGNPFLIPTFLKVLEDLLENKKEVLCGYTPPGGLAALNDLYPKYILKGIKLASNTIIRCIPTHGGSGGLNLSIANMAGETIISHYPFWPNYNLIAKQNNRKISGFLLHDQELNFNLPSFKEIVTQVAEKEKRIFLLINSPYSNPTGSSITDAEWEAIAEILKNLPVPKILALDLAYVDFGSQKKDTSVLGFIPKIQKIDPDIDMVLIPSASKAFMAYGWRLGAAILLTSKTDEADLWYNVFEGATRGSNSNNTTAGQQALSIILASEQLTNSAEREREDANKIIQNRFRIFQEAADKAGLIISKPTGGYFTMVYLNNPDQVAAKLEERDIFTIPINQPEGLRISICSLNMDQCARLPGEIARAM